MFVLTNQTLKTEFLQYLSRNASGQEPLEIDVFEFPTFLSSPVSFTIFLYQINNYPRKLVWKTKNAEIYNFLQSSDVDALFESEDFGLKNEEKQDFQPQNYFISDYKSDTKTESNPNYQDYQPPFVKNYDEKITQKQNLKQSFEDNQKDNLKKATVVGDPNSTSLAKISQNTNFQGLVVISTPSNHLDFYNKKQTFETQFSSNFQAESKNEKFIQKYSQANSLVIAKNNLDFSQNNTAFKENKYQEEGYKNDYESDYRDKDVQGLSESGRSLLSTKNLFEKEDYQPSSLISSSSVLFGSQDDLDSMLNRVEKTQDALKKIRDHEKSRVLNQQNMLNAQQKFGLKIPFAFYIFSGVFTLFVILFGTFFLFPTQAYTVSVDAEQIQEKLDLPLKKTDFNKRTATFTVSAEAKASGTQTVATDRASGKVKLVSSGKSCSVTNGGFYVFQNGLYYRNVKNPKLTNTLIIPENSAQTLSGLEVDVVAENSGANYNTGIGTKFSITNLRRGNVGTSCTAVAVGEIKNVEISGQRIFTEEDARNLRAKADEELAIKRLQEITNLIDEKAYLDDQGAWFLNLEESEAFSAEFGKNADNVVITKTVTTEMYYLTMSIFQSEIQKIKPNVAELTEVLMNKIEGSLIEDKKVSLSLFVKYKKSLGVQKSEIQTSLENGSNSEEIKQKYPSIQSITSSQTGINIPGISPRVQVVIK